MTTKVYELYPYGGSFSVKTIDYHGTAYLVAATSVRQAYAVAHKDVLAGLLDRLIAIEEEQR